MALPSSFSISMKHIRTNLLLLTLTAFLACFANESRAQNGFVSDASAASAGLSVAWSMQLQISAREELVDWQLVVDENRATTYVVIEYGKRKEVIAESDLSPFGVPYGVEGAEKAAADRKEIIEYSLRNDGKEDVEVNISSYSLPKSSLYALGQSGQVVCLDADSGGVLSGQRFTAWMPRTVAFCGRVAVTTKSVHHQPAQRKTFMFRWEQVVCKRFRSTSLASGVSVAWLRELPVLARSSLKRM